MSPELELNFEQDNPLADTLQEEVAQLRAWRQRLLYLESKPAALSEILNEIKHRSNEIEEQLSEFDLLNLFPG